MMAAYLGRLVCLCLASFSLVYLAAGLAALLLTPVALRRAEAMKPRSAARLLFALRVMPFAAALAAVLGLCVPSYLWLEPWGATESVGVACAAAVVLGIVISIRGLLRSLPAVAGSLAYAWRYSSSAHEIRVRGEAHPVLVVDVPAPLLALAGVFRPRLLISREVFDALAPEELEAALRHERAHLVSGDNWKRLAFLLAPEVIPFAGCFAALEGSWAKFSEWAADDEARGGDARRALSLASALVQVARLGAAPPKPLMASLTACGSGLEARVDRLLRTAATPEEFSPRGRAAGSRPVLLAGGLLVVLTFLPVALSCVHGLLEKLVQ